MAVEWWLVALLGAAPVALATGLRRTRRAGAVPLADTARLAPARRRATAVRAGLVGIVAALLAAAAVLAGPAAGPLEELVSEERSTVVVLDISSSIGDIVFREIANTLRGVIAAAGSSGRLGLVLFSDFAQEALPPGTRAAEVEPFIRYFEPLRERGVRARPVAYRAAAPGAPPPTRYPMNPWSGRFSGGTRISTGLAAARAALERDAGGTGRVLLVSDLAEAEEDLGTLMQELVAFSRSPAIDLRVVALPPATETEMAVFRRVLGRPDAVVSSLELERRARTAEQPRVAFPGWVVGCVGFLALALAAYEIFASPLAWRRPRPTGETA